MILAAFIGSDDFWSAIIGGGITTIVGLLALWGALYAANPRRGFIWQEVRNVSLLRDSVNSVSVSHDGNPISEPRLVDLAIRNNGKRDIEASMFSNSTNSLIFDFKLPIIGVVDSTAHPAHSGVPTTSVAGTLLHVHPFLISRGHTITFSVLLDGPQEKTEISSSQIAQNPAREGNIDRPRDLRERLLDRVRLVLAFACMVGLGITSYQIADSALEEQSKKRDPLPLKPEKATVQNCKEWQQKDQEAFIRLCIPAPGSAPAKTP
ncbi:hypothetical protein [Streptomyces liangshanensis]|uniref:Uncharacterized protein n=1 Tax=Streptomyces liangshanensis TaxID=2717324 RepID=A0A6G9H2H5_9ACTN|nr:hypothetical protein [Streptomyces liangshanensis]QIQ04489.1 hypothetical protein HA039_21265 [Streptomyces liangshanensis]